MALMDRPLLAIVDSSDECDVETRFLDGQAVVRAYAAREEAALPEELAQAVGLMVRSGIRLTNRTIERLARCRVIVRAGVGFDNVDGEAAGGAGIPLLNVPDYGTNEVADHTLALLLAAWRQVVTYHDALRADPVAAWRYDGAGPLRRLTGATLGIVGLGRIGTAVALRAKAFGMLVRYYDPYRDDGYDKTYQIERVQSLSELVGASDVLSLHAPLTRETDGIVDAALLGQAKAGLVLVNTGRGRLVVLDAVYDALQSSQVRAFATDVLEAEPPNPHHPLLAAFARREPWLEGRMIVTPHAAFYSEESLHEVRTKACEALLRALRGEPLANCVNKPFLANPRTPVL
jgi:phosphoglycerate dehydrogenase-like enzyme